jgi:hypothetical protein
MKNVFLVAVALGLSACMQRPELTPQQQADGIKACESAGAYGKVVEDEYGRAISVRCQKDSAEAVCLRKGGIPITSTWDGRLTGCIFAPEKKGSVSSEAMK